MVRRSVGTDCGNFFIMRIIVGTDGGNVCKAKNRW